MDEVSGCGGGEAAPYKSRVLTSNDLDFFK